MLPGGVFMENDGSFTLAEIFDKSEVAFCVIQILLDNAGEPYDWKFTYLNEALARLEGKEKDELLGNTFFTIFPNADRKWFKYYYVAAYEDKNVSFEEISEEIGLYLKIYCVPIKKGYCGCIIEDITELYESQQREKESNVKTETALKEAERANRAKTTFLSNVSHELRAPLNSINGYNWLAIEHIDDKGKVKAYLEKAYTAGTQLMSLIEDVLDITRIESGRLVLKKASCDLSILLEEVIGILTPEIEKKCLKFQYGTNLSEETVVNCDAGRVKQVLINVLGNAVKFTPEGGNISFDVCEKESGYEFKIADNGVGMNEEFLSRIYVPFERADSSYVKGIKGMGLGMPITKSIVDAMGGSIDLSSELGKGTIFSINIPMDKLWETSENNPEYNPQILQGKRILFIENKEYNLDVAKEFLLYIGADITSVTSTEEVIQKLKEASENAYDILVLDFQLLGKDKHKTVMKIKSLKDALHLKVIIVAISAHALEEDIRKAQEIGVDVYLTKPVRIKQLCEKLSKFM